MATEKTEEHVEHAARAHATKEPKIDVSGTEKAQKAFEQRQVDEEKEVECTVVKNNTQIKDRSYNKGDKVKLKIKELRLLDIQGIHVDHPKLPEIKDEE